MTNQLRDQIGRYGIWRTVSQASGPLAAEIERFGFGALWIGGSPAGDLNRIEELLDATTELVVGTSIVNMWRDDARLVARSYARMESRYPGRCVLGVGTGHREATRDYQSPFDTLSGYVRTLLHEGVPRQRLALAALGPKVLRLAGEQAAGALPYLTPPEHTRQARQILGPGPLLAPEHKVVLDTDADRAMALGRLRVRPYLSLINYTNNLRRLGWAERDLTGDGCDALIDELVARGTADQVAARVGEHLAAGADHVAIQLLTEATADPAAGYRELAGALSL